MRADDDDTVALPNVPPTQLPFTSNDARRAVFDVFTSVIKPMLPKPQGDGSFKEGDPALMDTMLVTPISLVLPRPERLADIIKPTTGWDEASLERVRSSFALAAAGKRSVHIQA